MGKTIAEIRLTNFADVIRAEDGRLPNAEIRTVTIPGIVDTGAAMLVIPESVSKLLGVEKSGETSVRYADHRKATRDIVQGVRVDLLGRSDIFSAVVEPSRTEALIGAIVLEALDLLVDSRKQVLVPRDPEMILTEIE